MELKNAKVAIVHDWLTGMRGGEKCLEVFCELFPSATLFTLVHKKGSVSRTIERMDVRPSFLQRIPGALDGYRSFLPLFPAAIESFDLKDYDLVLSSSHCAAKGAKRPDGALHVCYCYTPVRYAWKFFDEYFSGERPLKKRLISLVMGRIRRWDLASNKRIDNFVAISDNVRGRIREYYGRAADVIYPPADITDRSDVKAVSGDYYLIVSALVPYKRVDLAIEAFNRTGKKLLIIGSGNVADSLMELAQDNIEFRGWASDAELSEYYAGCRALIFPGEEDFGIVPVEAQAYGKPVIAYGAGGATETVVPLAGDWRPGISARATGVFFPEQTADALNAAIERFEESPGAFDPAVIRENAMRFNRDRFKREIHDYLLGKWEEHTAGRGGGARKK